MLSPVLLRIEIEKTYRQESMMPNGLPKESRAFETYENTKNTSLAIQTLKIINLCG